MCSEGNIVNVFMVCREGDHKIYTRCTFGTVLLCSPRCESESVSELSREGAQTASTGVIAVFVFPTDDSGEFDILCC